MDIADILIAEDDAVLSEVYQKKFSIAGHTIRLARNGEEAITEILKKHPDILILDFQMPMMDGFQVLEKFPKQQRSFPVIALTNFGDEHTKTRAGNLGVDGYFVKRDMTIKHLVEMVEKLLRDREKP
jgi:DNA-binding response OmpR family regulator